MNKKNIRYYYKYHVFNVFYSSAGCCRRINLFGQSNALLTDIDQFRGIRQQFLLFLLVFLQFFLEQFIFDIVADFSWTDRCPRSHGKYDTLEFDLSPPVVPFLRAMWLIRVNFGRYFIRHYRWRTIFVSFFLFACRRSQCTLIYSHWQPIFYVQYVLYQNQ